ncbi:MAG TPA: hypothetical protein PK228_04105 [Saprospiraceae bacterium]|nr:hypothetical protein [Saprospiraceae bacterium]
MKKTVFGAVLFLVIVTTGLFQFCVQPPNYPDEPVIEFVSLSKNVMRQTKLGPDTVLVMFNFTDGDGDLGSQDNEPNIFIEDGRDSFLKDPYAIPYIEPQGAGNGISGMITIALPTTCCIYPDINGIKFPPCDTSKNAPQQLDTVFYRIYIKDRAGNVSNKITTDPITLICRQ